MARTPRAEIARQLDELAALLAERPRGWKAAELAEQYTAAYGRTIPYRTLMRRLDELRRQGRVLAEGPKSNRRYGPRLELTRTGGVEQPPAQRPDAPGAAQTYVPLSDAGAAVRALIRRPISARPPVGYRPEFLEAYHPGATWYLGEADRARLRHLGSTPLENQPAGTYARTMLERLLIDLSWASSRLEGNTYSMLDTEELLRFGREPGGRDARETQMILNHKAAIELLVEEAGDLGFDRRTFTAIHAALAENLLGNRAEEGALRTRLVGIGGSAYTPTAIPQKIEECFALMLRKAGTIPDPFEQALFIMVQLPYLQPFGDVNKRTSRLGANLPLIKANLCPLSFVDVPNEAYVEGTLAVYELQRVELLRDVFVWAYERSCARYTIVRDAIPEPDPIRLHYREALREFVHDMVSARTLPDVRTIEEWADDHDVARVDRSAFVDSARAELLALHDGVLRRYGLRPSQFGAWMAAVSG